MESSPVFANNGQESVPPASRRNEND